MCHALASPQGLLQLHDRAPSVDSKGHMDCLPCGEVGIKCWGRSCRACLYTAIRHGALAARPGQRWRLPGWLRFWPDVKTQGIVLKQAAVLLLSGISTGHQLALAKESWAVSDLIQLVTGTRVCKELPAPLRHFKGGASGSVCLRCWFSSPGFSPGSHVEHL